ncbi:MAG TPA: hypothetical protein VFQ45_17250 [Longimicrobium sp.]|nr:hypothetical protein [Longimicrobium sp.]
MTRAVSLSCLLLAALAAGCRDAPPPAPPPGETNVAARPADAGLAEQSRRVMVVALAAAGARGDRVRMYAKVPGRAELVAVRDSTAWPDDVETTYAVAADEEGRILQVAEVPASQSGDWHNVYTHYFDAEGRTRGFVRESSFFNGCPRQGTRERTESLFDARGRLVQRRHGLTDFDGREVDPAGCEFLYRFPYRIHLTVQELLRETGLPAPR